VPTLYRHVARNCPGRGDRNGGLIEGDALGVFGGKETMRRKNKTAGSHRKVQWASDVQGGREGKSGRGRRREFTAQRRLHGGGLCTSTIRGDRKRERETLSSTDRPSTRRETNLGGELDTRPNRAWAQEKSGETSLKEVSN